MKGGELMADLAKQCLRYRAKHRLTQQEMGIKCGVDRTVILDVEQGRKKSKLTEEKIRIVLEEDEGGRHDNI